MLTTSSVVDVVRFVSFLVEVMVVIEVTVVAVVAVVEASMGTEPLKLPSVVDTTP